MNGQYTVGRWFRPYCIMMIWEEVWVYATNGDPIHYEDMVAQ